MAVGVPEVGVGVGVPDVVVTVGVGETVGVDEEVTVGVALPPGVGMGVLVAGTATIEGRTMGVRAPGPMTRGARVGRGVTVGVRW